MRAQTIEINLVKYLRPAKCCKQKNLKKNISSEENQLGHYTKHHHTRSFNKPTHKKIMQHK